MCLRACVVLMTVVLVASVAQAASINKGKYTNGRDEVLSTNDIEPPGSNFAGFRRTTPLQSDSLGTIIIKKGRYVPGNDGAYVHVPDKRERGKYVHVAIPYNGGYGPYSGVNLPYEYDPHGEYSADRYQTTQKPPPPAVTTPAWPKRIYDDEGKWKIIRQDEMKQSKKYQYLYETENGIYAQEQAVIGKNQTKTGGTQGEGFYQYIGDDDRIYRVEYTVGSQGYHPKLYIMPNPLSNRTTKAPKPTTITPTKMPMFADFKRPSTTLFRTRATTARPTTTQTTLFTNPTLYASTPQRNIAETDPATEDVSPFDDGLEILTSWERVADKTSDVSFHSRVFEPAGERVIDDDDPQNNKQYAGPTEDTPQSNDTPDLETISDELPANQDQSMLEESTAHSIELTPTEATYMLS